MEISTDNLRSIYHFGSEEWLSDPQFNAFIALCNKEVMGKRSVTSSENCVIRGDIPGIGRVVIKHYHRGGLFRYFMANSYLRSKTSRSEDEFKFLQKVRALGISAPRPIAYASKGKFLYQAWLATMEIPEAKNLVTLIESNPELADRSFNSVAEQILLLIKNKIYHIDLHPANVLIDANQNAYIIDFDKAREFKGTYNQLRDLYICRWRRSVIKHKLPEQLSEEMCVRLRINLD